MKNRDENSLEPCQVCGDIGVGDLIMTCFHCRQVREHIYCARICLKSVPDMWLCQVCRSSTRVLQISNLVDNDIRASRPEISSKLFGNNRLKKECCKPQTTSNDGSRLDHPPSHGLMLLAHSCPQQDKKASLVSNDTSQNKKQEGAQFVAFPSPKRRRRTLRLAEDSRESNHERAQSTYPCVSSDLIETSCI